MTTASDVMQLDWLPDPDTDAQLLHSAMRPRDNRRRLRHCKNAVIWAMGHLKPEHREQISLFYGARMSKSQIAARQNLSKSAVSKSIRHGEDKLRDYAALYMEVYDRLEQEFLLED